MDGTPHLRSNETDDESTCGTYSAPSGNSVGWAWNAGTANVTNDASATGVGSIDSTYRANTDAGFSIVSYTGTGSSGTVAHGLNAAPKLIILTNREQSYDWYVFGNAIDSTFDERLTLNSTAINNSSTSAMDATAPTSTVFTVGNNAGTNGSGDAQLALCWSEVEGYSKFGSYEGNNSTDGTYVHLGFHPAFIMIKNIDATADWTIYDTARDTYNASSAELYPDTDGAEFGSGPIDILSNGFKQRSQHTHLNKVYTYIYCAWAETPFKYSNAK